MARVLWVTVWRATIACPDCQPGRAARAWIVGDHFWSHLAIALAPFVVVAALTLYIHRMLARADAAAEEPSHER
ncbi:MAG: hypothetical protein JWM53_3653 [bacterium]|nr:hypothetical protein [bacterium]